MRVVADQQASEHWWLKDRYKSQEDYAPVLLQLYRSATSSIERLVTRSWSTNGGDEQECAASVRAWLLVIRTFYVVRPGR